MLRFLLAFASVYVSLWVWAVYADSDPFGFGRVGAGRLAAILVGVPCVTAWGAAELLERIRPRRVFDARVRRSWTRILAGFGAGLLSVVLVTPMIVWLDDKAPDGMLLAAASALGTACVLFLLRRKRRGECVHCGYDLSAAPEPRCSECGAMYSVV
jgi:hypothetical protein